MTDAVGRDPARILANTIKRGECLIWTGCVHHTGYGVLSHRNRQERAHRYSFLAHGGVIAPGQVVMHSCDVRACVNPDHLSAGSTSKNLKDAYDRGLAKPRSGELHGMSRLNREQVLEIRQRYSGGATQLELAKMFGVTFQMISRIVLRKAWKHV